MSRFSARLPLQNSLSPLAAREADLRAKGIALLDLCSANPTTVGFDYPAEALAQALAQSAADLVYAPAPLGLESARFAVAGEFARMGAGVPPEHIILGASTSELYSWLGKLLCDPGDIVLVPSPSYPLFQHLLALEGIVAIPYPLFYEGGGAYVLTVAALNDAIGGVADPSRVRALVCVSPNNPTGTVLSTADLSLIDAFAAQHNLTVIVDEVFADYADPLDSATTVASTCPRALTFALGGLSKSAGLPQLKVGWMAVLGPAQLVSKALQHLELIADTYLSVSTPVQRALPALIDLGAQIRAQLQRRLHLNRATLTEALAGPDIVVADLSGSGGWSAILRLPAVRSDQDWALRLLDEHHLIVQPGYFYELDQLPIGCTVVLSLLTPPGLFREGLQRLLCACAAD